MTLRHDLVAHRDIQRAMHVLQQERARIPLAESGDEKLGKSGEDVVTDARPRSADERDAFGMKTAADESEDLYGRLVQPLGIVDDTDERLLFGDTRAQRQGGEPDEEPFRRGAFAEPEDGRKRVALGSGELVEVIQHRPAELM